MDQRSNNILNNRTVKLNQASVSASFLIGFYLSTAIVTAPFCEDCSGIEGKFLINEDHADIIINSNNKFGICVEDHFLENFQTITDKMFLM